MNLTMVVTAAIVTSLILFLHWELYELLAILADALIDAWKAADLKRRLVAWHWTIKHKEQLGGER